MAALPPTSDRLFDESWYRATASAVPTWERLTGDDEADLVVIGAGYTGLATALRAAEQGQRVAIVEAQFPGFGASGRNGGQLIPGWRWDARTLVARLGRERGKALFDLGLDAARRVQERIAQHAIACHPVAGHATMAWSNDHYRDLAEEAEFLNRVMGYEDIELVSADAGRYIVSSELYHGGLIDRRGGHFHPLNYALGLARAAMAAGVRLWCGAPADAVERDGDGVIVTVGTHRIRAARAMLAADTGMASVDAKLGAYAMPILNYNVATAPLSAAQADALIPSRMAIADTRFVLNYFRLSHDNRLIFGGGEKYLPSPPRSIDDFVRKHIAAVFPQLAQHPIDYRWGGAVGVSLNRLPHVGHSDDRRIWFAHGFSGHGALLTTLAGEAIADAMAGEDAAFRQFAALPARRFPGGTLLRWPLHVAGMLFYAMKDRL